MWTQTRLAREAGVSPTTISGIETGKIVRPHFGTLGKLARALRVAPEELLGSRRSIEQQGPRSEEHTSELQSRQYLVCRLLLEKKTKSHLYLLYLSLYIVLLFL